MHHSGSRWLRSRIAPVLRASTLKRSVPAKGCRLATAWPPSAGTLRDEVTRNELLSATPVAVRRRFAAYQHCRWVRITQQLLPHHLHIDRRDDAELHPITVDTQHLNRDPALDRDPLLDLSHQYQHPAQPSLAPLWGAVPGVGGLRHRALPQRRLGLRARPDHLCNSVLDIAPIFGLTRNLNTGCQKPEIEHYT